MNIKILKMPFGIKKWDLVYEFYELRRKTFVDDMAWPLITQDGIEFDQYDSANLAHYVLAEDEAGKIIAGARLLRCDVEIGHGKDAISYMIRDAVLGRIDLPRNIWGEGDPPVSDKYWELTRLASRSTDPSVNRNILAAVFKFLSLMGAKECIALTSPALVRLTKSYGYETTRRGPILGNKDGRFCAFSVKIADM